MLSETVVKLHQTRELVLSVFFRQEFFLVSCRSALCYLVFEAGFDFDVETVGHNFSIRPDKVDNEVRERRHVFRDLDTEW